MMSTPEKPDGPDGFMDLDHIEMEAMEKMFRAREARKALPTIWSFSIWERRPAIWAPGFAFSLNDGAWVPVNSSEVGMEARSSTREAVEAEFGALPEPPPFPRKEVAAAFEEAERRGPVRHD